MSGIEMLIGVWLGWLAAPKQKAAIRPIWFVLLLLWQLLVGQVKNLACTLKTHLIPFCPPTVLKRPLFSLSTVPHRAYPLSCVLLA